MINNKIINEIKIFADSLKKGYEHCSFSSLLCRKMQSTELDTDKEFIMIPIRIEMMYEDFNGRVSNELLGRDLGDNIANMEFNYIVSQLKAIQEDKYLDTTNSDSIIHLLKDLPGYFKPRFLLIPIMSKYYHNIHGLISQGLAKYDKEGLVIYHNGNKIQIIWSNNYRPLDNNLFLLGENSIVWKQKVVKDMKPISNIDYSKYNEVFGETSELSFIYGDIGNEKIDFIARIVAVIEIKVNLVKKYSINPNEIEPS